MIAVKVETTVQNDGELHLTHLPCRKGDRVEAIILLLDAAVQENNLPHGKPDRRTIWDAVEQLWRHSSIDSQGDRLTRDQRHERR